VKVWLVVDGEREDKTWTVDADDVKGIPFVLRGVPEVFLV